MDTKVILDAQNGDQEAFEYLLNKYNYVISARVEKVPAITNYIDKDDIWQEARIGFWEAIKNFQAGKTEYVKAYFSKCIGLHLIDATQKPAYYYKNTINSFADSLNAPVEGEEYDMVKEEVITGNEPDPLDKLAEKENIKEFMQELLEKLSELEESVLRLRVQGYSYSEIAEQKGRNYKSIDNATKRMTKKARKVIRGTA